MKTILFPTDFSATAGNAFVFALHLADKMNATINVLHAFTLPVLSERHIYPDLMSEVYESLELEKFENYVHQVPQLRKISDQHGFQHVPLYFVFEQGTVVSAIEKINTKEETDLIVMGTTGASGFQKKWMGSNAVNLISMVEQPVLCIPHGARFEGISNIGFTTIFREADRKALHNLIPFSIQLDAAIKCFHAGSINSHEAFDAISNWHDEFAAHKYQVHVKNDHSVKEAILKFVEDEQINILAMVKRNRGFFSELFMNSISNGFAFHENVPLLVIHEQTEN